MELISLRRIIGDTFSYGSLKIEMSIFKIPMMKKLTAISFLLFILFAATSLTNCTTGFIPEDITPTPPTNLGGTVTYQTHISKVISNSCISCHGGSNPQGNLLLESYTQVRNAAENGTLIQRINDAADPMPTSGLLPAQTRALFDEWVQNGYLEN